MSNNRNIRQIISNKADQWHREVPRDLHRLRKLILLSNLVYDAQLTATQLAYHTEHKFQDKPEIFETAQIIESNCSDISDGIDRIMEHEKSKYPEIY